MKIIKSWIALIMAIVTMLAHLFLFYSFVFSENSTLPSIDRENVFNFSNGMTLLLILMSIGTIAFLGKLIFRSSRHWKAILVGIASAGLQYIVIMFYSVMFYIKLN